MPSRRLTLRLHLSGTHVFKEIVVERLRGAAVRRSLDAAGR